jgi:glycosyltransferase involved in cell wall biosynthesis
VSPSKGEGFSIQPREALALGIPVIVTNNTGQQDLCDSGHVVSLPAIRAEPALFPWGETYGMNFTCDEEKLAMSLLTVYENYESCLCVSRKGREWVKQFLYHNLRDNYRALIAPTIMEFGKENIIENGKLYTNSEELFKKIQKLFSPKNLNGE